ncbi:hypothetical protein BGY98DRAFT_369776 [Russula aff. rugulosa BPL654]|nr:hypothetical protein BGY98DRAFT_369776 [Russula aff. rugulosa BPL654]
MTTRRLHRYHGHRRNSFICADVDELVELRAHQRTYNGAYVRTALGILGFALAVLRLFDRKFYRIGLLYAALAFFLTVCAFLRARHSRHDYADRQDTGDTANIPTIRTVGQDHKQLFGRPFVTAGRIVALVACVVAATEIVLLALVLWL